VPVRQDDFKYWAFISYSSRDREWAEWLSRALERYRIPGALVGRTTGRGTVPARLFPVFRDRDELRAGGDVGEALEAALIASRHLIVVCSPSAADPASWVSREIEHFKAAGRERDVLALVVDGEPHASRTPGREADECFPLPLRYRFDADGRMTDEPADPLAADVRREDRRPREARRKALLKLVARMVDVDFDELAQRDRRRRRRQAVGWMTAAAALLAVLAIAAMVSLQQGRDALSQRLAEAAGANAPQTDLALLLAAMAYRVEPTPAAHRSLIETIRSNPHLVTYAHRAARVHDIAFSPDGSLLAVAGCDGDCARSNVLFLGTDTLQPSGSAAAMPGEITHLRFQNADRLLVAYRDGPMHRVVAVNPAQPDGPSPPVFSTNEPITALAVSHDGNLYAVATDTETKIFDRRAGGLHCWVDTGGPVVAMAFARNGRAFAASVDRGTLGTLWARLEDRESSSCRPNRVPFASRPSDIGFDADGEELYVTGRDGVVLRRRLGGSTTFGGDTFTLTHFSAEGYWHWLGADSRLLLSHFGNHVRIYDLDERRRIADALEEAVREEAGIYQTDALRRALGSVEAGRLHHVGPARAVVDPDGRPVATFDEYGVVQLWTIGADPLVTLSAEFSADDEERREAVSADGRLRAVAEHRSEGCTGDYVDRCQAWTELRLFDARSGADIATIAGPSRHDPVPGVLAAAFAPDGRLTVRREMYTEVWTLLPEALVERACRTANRALTEEEAARHLPAWWRWISAGRLVCG
jgi:WD40 repeat protein